MCGIAGHLDLQGTDLDPRLAERMLAALAHRGPDRSCVGRVAVARDDPSVTFLHTRLSVIDLTAAADQPMTNEGGTVHVVFNGELYGFRELRARLTALGHRFRSTGDTEVIVHAYEEYGDRLVDHLDGMFAFALWDAGRRRLLLARDRAGKKPLYYAWDGRRLTFASEMKALRLCPWVDTSVAWDRVPELLGLGYVPWPATLHPGIRQLPPASTAVVDDRGLSDPEVYWDLEWSDRARSRRSEWPAATIAVRDRLRSAVERRLVADVPVGVLLSGGLDSAVIVALMAELGSDIRTFTVGIGGGDPSYDERPFARMVADRFGTDHIEVLVDPDAAAMVEHVVWHLDQPMTDSSALPTYLIAKAAREHVTVALTGDGSDEVFGGYDRFRAALVAGRVPPAAGPLLRVLASSLPRSGSYFGRRRRVERFAADLGLPVETRYRGWVAPWTAGALDDVLEPEIAAGSTPFASLDAALAASPMGTPLLHRLLDANFRTYLHDDLLVKTDRMTMAASLEARSPFLDTGLIELLASLPADMKATPFAAKRVLRRAFADVVPKEVLTRPKHGFGVPVDRWFRAGLGDLFGDLVLAPDARSSDALRPEAVRRMFDDHVAGRQDLGPRLWGVLVLEVWLRGLANAPPGAGA
ncbi:MAG TPA: asparagine synthase (glutamine-hydrolyzing) [Acidimicrobiales bacterium]|nr:asparagine synthase (glutamine-hydrolyzing) [Acidimicrobiales bacterium]